MKLRTILISGVLILGIVSSLRFQTSAQVRPIYDQGALGLAQLLARINTQARALMIGAHPDDEDTALLAYLARGEHARTAYLSLTRGDGGQNIIGPELGEALGVIRTEELIQARRLDGAEQFFTRAYDYGFSKTLDEAKQKWDEKVILCDVVRVIRYFKPHVVIAQFNGTATDGHGHHQFAGYITPIALRAAADGAQCSASGEPWIVSKLYVRHRGQGEPTLRINTGKYDPLLGRSYFEIAMQARSQHRSQEQGVLELKGPQYSNLTLDPGSIGRDADGGIFGGIPSLANTRKQDFKDYDPSRPELLSKRLADSLPSNDVGTHAVTLAALSRSVGLKIDVLTDREIVTPGESVPVVVRAYWHAGNVRVTSVDFNLPATKTPEPTSPTAQGPFRRETANFSESYLVSIPRESIPTQPYWLLSPRQGDLYTIPDSIPANPLLQPRPASVRVGVEVEGKSWQLHVPIEYRFADDIRGEIRRDLNVAPKITVAPDKNLLIVSTRARDNNREVSVQVSNHTSGPVTGKVRLVLPDGWKSLPSTEDFSLSRKGESTSARFIVHVPRGAATGSFEIRAEATSNGETFAQAMQTIAYEHIQTHRIYRPSKVDVRLIDVQTAPAKVGYVRGSGDRVPDALRQLGLSVEEISDADLAAGDLTRFQTIVVGIRAYQVRPVLVSNNQRLLEFARRGGTLLVQYQLPPTYSQANMTPFPAQMGPRVSDENAAVKIVDPAHPLLTYPNKISASDFEGWVQERNLYNFSTMDPQYVGLLESHDAGEAENRGGLVVAALGKGRFIYCSYSLFRQLPAGVPGAYRLLANLVSPVTPARPR